MTNLKNILNNGWVRLIVLILLALLVFLLTQIFSNNVGSTAINNSSNYCRVADNTGGIISVKSYVTNSTRYDIWVHFESPVQLIYDQTSDMYNPLLLNIDNTNCYKLGGNSNFSLNTWVWINNLNTLPNQDFNVNLTRGNHTFAFSSNYVNIDRILLISNGCDPVGNGSNCDSSSNSDINIPN